MRKKGKVNNPTGKGGIKKGEVRNPRGNPGIMREVRENVSAMLAEAMQDKVTGCDMLVTAIVGGVKAGDSRWGKIACEYRWGKPVQRMELTGKDGAPLIPADRLSDDELAEIAKGIGR